MEEFDVISSSSSDFFTSRNSADMEHGIDGRIENLGYRQTNEAELRNCTTPYDGEEVAVDGFNFRVINPDNEPFGRPFSQVECNEQMPDTGSSFFSFDTRDSFIDSIICCSNSNTQAGWLHNVNIRGNNVSVGDKPGTSGLQDNVVTETLHGADRVENVSKGNGESDTRHLGQYYLNQKNCVICY